MGFSDAVASAGPLTHTHTHTPVYRPFVLQCFDAVGWAAGRAPGR